MKTEKKFAKNYVKAAADAKKKQTKRKQKMMKSLYYSYMADFKYRQKIGEIPKNEEPNF